MLWIFSKILGHLILIPLFLWAFIFGSVNDYFNDQDFEMYKSHIQEFENIRSTLEMEKIRFIGFGDCKRIIFWTIEDEEYRYMANPLSVECATNVGYAEFDQLGEYKWSKIKQQSENLLPNNDIDTIKIEDLWSDGIDSIDISFSEQQFGRVVGLLYETRENLRPNLEDLYHKQFTENWFITLYDPSPF